MRTTQAIVQIGLYRSAEYVHLVDPEKFDTNVVGASPPILFSELESETDWHYWGVDMTPKSIEKCRELFKTFEDNRLHFIEALVHRRDGDVFTHNGFNIHEDLADHLESHTSTSISLDSLFKQIPMPVNLLVLDVEGAEDSILMGYSWAHKPKYILVEMHASEDLETVTKIMKQQGYYLRCMTYHQGVEMHCGYMLRKNAPRRRGGFSGDLVFYPM